MKWYDHFGCVEYSSEKRALIGRKVEDKRPMRSVSFFLFLLTVEKFEAKPELMNSLGPMKDKMNMET